VALATSGAGSPWARATGVTGFGGVDEALASSLVALATSRAGSPWLRATGFGRVELALASYLVASATTGAELATGFAETAFRATTAFAISIFY
jgi:hypothetical protein